MNMYRVINNVKRRRRFRGEERDRDALLRTRRALPRAIRRQYPRNRTPKLRSATRSDQRRSRVAPHPPPSANPSGRRPRTLRRSRPSPARAAARIRRRQPACGLPSACRPSACRPSACHPSACRPSTCRPSARHPSGPSPSSRSGASRSLPAASRFAAARAARLPSSPPARRNPGPAACAACPPSARWAAARRTAGPGPSAVASRPPPARRARRRRPSPEAPPPPVRPG